MTRLLEPLAYRLWPGLRNLPEQEQRFGLMSVYVTMYGVPLAIVGVIWLAFRFDFAVFTAHWPALLGIFLAALLTRIFLLYLHVEMAPGIYSTTTTHLDIAAWAGALIFGPTALVADLLASVGLQIIQWRSEDASDNWGKRIQSNLEHRHDRAGPPYRADGI